MRELLFYFIIRKQRNCNGMRIILNESSLQWAARSCSCHLRRVVRFLATDRSLSVTGLSTMSVIVSIIVQPLYAHFLCFL